jgi:hypothetical protein
LAIDVVVLARAKSASVQVLAASPLKSNCRRSVDGGVCMAVGSQKEVNGLNGMNAMNAMYAMNVFDEMRAVR